MVVNIPANHINASDLFTWSQESGSNYLPLGCKLCSKVHDSNGYQGNHSVDDLLLVLVPQPLNSEGAGSWLSRQPDCSHAMILHGVRDTIVKAGNIALC